MSQTAADANTQPTGSQAVSAYLTSSVTQRTPLTRDTCTLCRQTPCTQLVRLLLPTRDKLLPARDKILPAWDKLLPARDKLLPARDKLLQTRDKLLPARDKLLPATSTSTCCNCAIIRVLIIRAQNDDRQKASHAATSCHK